MKLSQVFLTAVLFAGVQHQLVSALDAFTITAYSDDTCQTPSTVFPVEVRHINLFKTLRMTR